MADAERTVHLPSGAVEGRLTREQDDELRRLHYLALVGDLSGRSRERILELRIRDRRQEIRQPREFEAGTGVGRQNVTARVRWWRKFVVTRG